MNLLETLKSKVQEIGSEEACKILDVPAGILSQFISGKKAPGLATCQKILDNWVMSENTPILKTAEELKEEEAVKIELDVDGIVNMSYCPPEWGAKKAAWENRDVCLCIPTYLPIPGESFFSFMALAMKYRMGIRLEHRHGDSMIARSRNQLCKRFLATGASWSIWLDSDMIFPFGNSGAYATQTGMRDLPDKFASVMTIERLISHSKTIIGGCYWDRRGSGRLIAGGSQPILNPIPSDSLAPVNFVGTGCLAVHRTVFEDIAKTFPNTLSDEAHGNETGFFTPIQDANRMLGEDESFAKRATDSGHPSYLDLGLILAHIGTTIHGMPAKGSRI